MYMYEYIGYECWMDVGTPTLTLITNFKVISKHTDKTFSFSLNFCWTICLVVMELKASLEFVRDEAALDISDDDDTAAEIVGILLLLVVPVPPLPPKDVIFLSWFIVDFAIRISILGDCCHFSWRRRQRRIVLGLFVVIVVAAVSCVQKMLKCFCCLFCLLAVLLSSACLCLHCVLSIVSVDDFCCF